MRLMGMILGLFVFAMAHAADAPAPRVSLFSTSTDWAAVTGLSLGQYAGKVISDKKMVGPKGLILYYLDGFPCYGEADSVRLWISPRGDVDGKLRLVCVHAPNVVRFAWRNAPADATERATTGMIQCPVTAARRDFTVDLGQCTREPDWETYR